MFQFHVHNVHVSVVNGLRRAILSDVPTVAMDFDIVSTRHTYDADTVVNTTAMSNEFICHRMSMVPIHFSPEEIDSDRVLEYVASIDVSSDEAVTDGPHSTRLVTSADIRLSPRPGSDAPPPTPADMARWFPADPVTGDHVLLYHMRTYEVLGSASPGIPKRIKFDNIPLMRAGGSTHARFCPVSVCGFSELTDQRKLAVARRAWIASQHAALADARDDAAVGTDGELLPDADLARRFDIEHAHEYPKLDPAGDACHFSFVLETVGGLRGAEVVRRAAQQVQRQLSAVRDTHERKVVPDFGGGSEVYTHHEDVPTRVYKVVIPGGGHTEGHIIQAVAHDAYVRDGVGLSSRASAGGTWSLTFVGYYCSHHLDKEVTFRLVFRKRAQAGSSKGGASKDNSGGGGAEPDPSQCMRDACELASQRVSEFMAKFDAALR